MNVTSPARPPASRSSTCSLDAATGSIRNESGSPGPSHRPSCRHAGRVSPARLSCPPRPAQPRGLGWRVALARIPNSSRSEAGLGRYPSRRNGLPQGVVVALVLVGVGLRERSQRAIEAVAGAEVASRSRSRPRSGRAPWRAPGRRAARTPSSPSGSSARPAPSPCRPRAGACRSPGSRRRTSLTRIQPSMMSLAAWVSRWPSTTRWPWLVNVLLPRKGSSTDACCLLELQEQRVVLVAAEHQHDPGARADAADADDLPRRVDVAIALEQLPAVGAQGTPVGADDSAHELLELGLFDAGDRPPRSGR